MQVVRTRRVRAIEERFYGRTARMFYVWSSGARRATTCLGTSTTSRSPPASRPTRSDDGKLWGFIRHARISEAQASDFWERMAELVAEFDRLPRSGETMYGFAVGVYPTDQPTLPSGGEAARSEPG